MSPSDHEIARRALLCWLLFPVAGIAAHALARATGHEGFLGRILVWLVVVPAFLGAAYLGPAALAVLLAASCTVACREVVRLGSGAGAPWPHLALFAAVSLPWLLPVGPVSPAAALATRLLAMAPAVSYPLLSSRVRARLGGAALALGLGASLSFWLLVRRTPDGLGWVVFGFSVVVVNDMLSFLAGRMLGGWRPWPMLSPGKTLAGYAGGTLAAVLVGYMLSFAVPDLGPVAIGGAAFLLVVCGSLGDLFVSAVKRRHGAKDAGTSLGPMGGMLDRLDSLLGAGWVLFTLQVLAGR